MDQPVNNLALHRRLWQWLRNQLVQDVAEEDALCVYDCRKPQCTEEEWATCDRRIERAAGELWPGTTPPSPKPEA